MLSLSFSSTTDAKEVVRLLLESEKTLSHSLFSPHPSLPARAFRRCLVFSETTTETAEMRERLLNKKFLSTRQSIDKSQLFYLKRKFLAPCPVRRKVGGKQRKERKYLEERTLCLREKTYFVCALFCPFSLFRFLIIFFFPFRLTDTYTYR